MKSVLLVSNEPLDVCSFYRLIGPYSELRDEFRFEIVKNPSAEQLWLSDIVIFSRPYNQNNLSVLKLARELQRKVVLDYDDDFMRVPDHGALAEKFNSTEQKRLMSQIFSMADAITVSTESVGEGLRDYYGGEVIKIENAFNDALYALPHEHNSESKVIVWRGHSSHRFDLDLLESDCIPEGYQFVMIGNVSQKIADRFPGVKIVPYMGMKDYFKFIRQIKPRLFLVPLQDTPFNRGKSNCAWIEATYAGAACAASNLPEWFPSEGEDIFTKRGIEFTLHNSSLFWSNSIKNIPLLSQVNEKRRQLLRAL